MPSNVWRRTMDVGSWNRPAGLCVNDRYIGYFRARITKIHRVV
jgi:hypothetical protein